MMFLRGALVLVVLVAAAMSGADVVVSNTNCSFVETPDDCAKEENKTKHDMNLTAMGEYNISARRNAKVPGVKNGAESRGNAGSDSATPTNGTQRSTGPRDAKGSAGIRDAKGTTTDAGSGRDAIKNAMGPEDAVATNERTTNERATRTGNVFVAVLIAALCAPFLA
ncbi:hypothetical protein ERJ75_001208000 [Trypanosoma vivax]|nr:hypothetical protein ERJ75_001208000 [Trypanosoma vivax]